MKLTDEQIVEFLIYELDLIQSTAGYKTWVEVFNQQSVSVRESVIEQRQETINQLEKLFET